MGNELIKVQSGSWSCHSRFKIQHFGDLFCLCYKGWYGEELPMIDVLYLYVCLGVNQNASSWWLSNLLSDQL
jgi:hypothetical protein